MKQEIIEQIEELFWTWYNIVIFDSTGTWGQKEKKVLLDFCPKHIEEFKKFAQDTLSRPQECCHEVASLCYKLLSAEVPHTTSQIIIKILRNEWDIFQPCNEWLNYFNKTEGVDYYKDYVEYKEYLRKHYISWKPNEEDDPNPTYEEFINNRKRYKI